MPPFTQPLCAVASPKRQRARLHRRDCEQRGAQVEARFGGENFRRRPHLRGVTLLPVAGVQYLLIRSRTIRVFGGTDLESDARWNLLKASLRATAHQLFLPGVTGLRTDT